MNKIAVVACAGALLAGHMVFAQPWSRNTTIVAGTDPVTGQRTERPATAKEREQLRKTLDSFQPSLANVEATLHQLKDLKSETARLQHMVETETPISTRTTSEGLVRTFRDGTTAIDSGNNRTFQARE